MQVNFDFEDGRGEHSYHYDWKAVPRVGEYVTLVGAEYKVIKVTWDDGLPTCKCEPTRRI